MSLDVDKIKHNNEELKLIINSSWDGIALIDNSYDLIYFNNAFIPMLGFNKDELNKLCFLDIIENSYKKSFLNLFKKSKKNNAIILCKRKDKVNIYLQITLTQSTNEKTFVMNAKDVTNEVANNKIIDKYVLKISVDNEGKILVISTALCITLGYKKEELLNENISTIEYSKKNTKPLWDTCLKEEEYSGLIVYKKFNNSPLYVKLNSSPAYNKYGDLIGYEFLLFDLSMQYKLKDKIKEQDSLILQQSKVAIMSETIQMLAHQWRQPLNLISINSQSLELSMDNNDLDKVYLTKGLNNITKEVSSLSKIIENFQQMIAVSNKVSSDAKDIISEAINIFKNSKDAQNIDFLSETMSTPKFETFKNELTTILINILTNAKEAIIKRKVKNGVIKLKEYYIDDTLYFEISDNAGGIEKEILDKIFEPYFSTKDNKHGVGLGLYMCKILIEMHFMGKIQIQNHGLGARFIISLPMKG